MNQETDAAMEPVAPTERVERGRLGTLVDRLARALDGELPTGDVAELRRMSPATAPPLAFWRLSLSFLEPAGWLPEHDGPRRDEAETRWTVVLGAMAVLAGLHRPGARLGAAAARAGVSELRLVRLLRARSPALADVIRTVSHTLAAKREPCDQLDLARLVWSEDREHDDSVRREIARHYYRELARI